MTRWMILLMVAISLAALGCGASEKDRGVNSSKDVPRTTSAE
jgi:hypothetical protein